MPAPAPVCACVCVSSLLQPDYRIPAQSFFRTLLHLEFLCMLIRSVLVFPSFSPYFFNAFSYAICRIFTKQNRQPLQPPVLPNKERYKFKSGCQAPKKATAGIEPAIWVEPVRKITQIHQNRQHISCKNLIHDIHMKKLLCGPEGLWSSFLTSIVCHIFSFSANFASLSSALSPSSFSLFFVVIFLQFVPASSMPNLPEKLRALLIFLHKNNRLSLQQQTVSVPMRLLLVSFLSFRQKAFSHSLPEGILQILFYLRFSSS